MSVLKVAALVLVLGATSCASSSITNLSRNRALISTSAAPLCRTTGAASVAQKMAAVATIRAGFKRFVIVGFGAQDNTRLVSTGPTSATTTGTVSTFGNTSHLNANTTFGGQTTFLSGRNNAEAEVVMLNPGDAGYEQGIDARETLGPEWQKIADEGVTNCLS